MTTTGRRPPPALGLRANAAQFGVLVGVNALVGGLLGQERTVVPLLASRVFGVTGYTTALTYIAAFGVVKAATNYVAGGLCDRVGRRPVLLAGWLVGLPVPLLLMWAPTWGWVVAANVLLGVNQGLTWSATVIMKIDLVGPERRGLAMGLNEAAGYGAVAVTALATGFLADRYGLRPAPFLLGLAYAALGLGLSAALVRETTGHAGAEAEARELSALRPREVFAHTSWRQPSLSAVCQAGLVNNLNDGLAWGLFPPLFAAAGLGLGEVGALVAVYPAVWGMGQVLTGPWSDRVGRKPPAVAGMVVQGVALLLVAGADSTAPWLLAAVLLGLGTALVYPTLLAAVGDLAHPAWRARAVGVYRLWRDTGFAVGAVLSGVLADAIGLRATVAVVAALTVGSGLVLAARMSGTAAPAVLQDDGMTLCLAQDPQADALLERDPFALVVGMTLDQQYPMEHAFRGPQKLVERLGGDRLDLARVAAYDPEAFADLAATPPAIHRYGRSMARRVQQLAQVFLDEYDGDPARLWTTARTGDELVARLRALPGWGDMKAQIFTALLGKQLGIRPKGWREAAGAYGEARATRSVADVRDAASLQKVRAFKQEAKQTAKQAAKQPAR